MNHTARYAALEETSSVTMHLKCWANGEPDALNQAVPRIYTELRRLAEAQPRGWARATLGGPALVNEAYLRLTEMRPVLCESRSRFFALVSSIMRGILIDHVRASRAQKRGGQAPVVTLSDDIGDNSKKSPVDLLDVNDAIDELARVSKLQAQIVEMRFFDGLSIEETAESLNVSPATIKREWTLARSWMKRRLSRPFAASSS